MINLEKIDIEGNSIPFKKGKKIGWIEWNSNGTFKEIHEEPDINRSLIIDPQYITYTWMTSVLTEVISKSESEIEFRTKNSHYLIKLK
jgi:hypothetical protein